MIEVLRKHLTTRLGNDLDNLDKVLATFKQISTKRNEQLLQQGDTCKYAYFIAKGCLQVYVYDKDFNETTRDIVIEELFAIDRQSFQIMMQTVSQFDKVYKQILEASYANSVYRINTFVSLSALDRIKWFMEYRPMLMPRLSSKLIASYLGINKDVFSRLKAQL